VKKLEKGGIGSFDAFLRVLRTLGRLDVLNPLEEEQLSPNEYYELARKAGAHRRMRAAGSRGVAKSTSSGSQKDVEDEVW